MDLWIPITLLAAASQTIRTAIQRKMKGPLGDYGASSIRFIYAVPFAWIWFLLIFLNFDHAVPEPNLQFAFWVTAGAFSQILFTVCLIRLFSYKNFLVGIAFSKTEVLLAAILEALFFAAVINLQFAAAIVMGMIAVVMLSLRGNGFSVREVQISLRSTATLLGLLAASTLATSVICFRVAVNSLPEQDFLFRAATAAAISIAGQALGMGIYLYIYRRSELKATLRLWKIGLLAGFFASISTIGWFGAFALHTVAPVRAVGQSELLFALGITLFVFRQRFTTSELLGTLLLTGSILLVILN